MYCKECGTQLPDGAMFCPNCGTGAASTAQDSTAGQRYAAGGPRTTPPPAAPVRHRHFPFGTIVAAVILAAAVWLLFSNHGVGPVSELKSVIFDQYDSVQPFGMAVKENMSSVKWSSEKRGNGSYDVTITGVDNMYGGLVEATFRVTHMGDAVYAVINRASVNGETCVGSTELTVVMLLLYGQLDEETLAGLMVWDSIW